MRNRVQRSWLITPANDEARLAAAADSGADVVVLDLQDTVHETRKHEARARVEDAISRMRGRGSEVYVRCDPELLYADFAASVRSGLHGVVLPGLTSAEQVREADRLLGEFEAGARRGASPAHGRHPRGRRPQGPEQALEIHLCMDTGRANWDAEELIKASPRVRSVSLGRAGSDDGLARRAFGRPSHAAVPQPAADNRRQRLRRATRRRVVAGHVARAGRIAEDTRQAAIDGRRAGFRGGLCIRANQARALNEGFTPTAGEVAQARAVADDPNADAHSRAVAQDTLSWAEACAARDGMKAQT